MTAKGLVLTEGAMIHMLADIDQIVTEMEMDYGQREYQEWIQMLRYAVEGNDYTPHRPDREP